MTIFNNKRILIIGDIMLDSYLFGTVDRISPEAPFPIVDITKKEHKLGGASNVANNIKNLGGTPILCSVIGKDNEGDILLSLLKENDISTKFIHQSKNRITTTKTRIIGNNHQMLRMDEEIKSNLNIDFKKFKKTLIDILNNQKIDCVLFQDYDKGIINTEIIDIISKKANNLKIPIIVDPKKNNFTHYKNITLFKPNFKEFKDSINLDISDKNTLLKEGSLLLHKKGIDIVFITLSEDGIFLSYEKNNKIINKIFPSTAKEILDVSGAGDTCISIISLLLGELDIEKITIITNIAGGLVCGEVGVTTIDKNKLMKEIDNLNII